MATVRAESNQETVRPPIECPVCRRFLGKSKPLAPISAKILGRRSGKWLHCGFCGYSCAR